jgi:4-hydroxy-2-oxoheptanedioate aldolase
MPNSVGENQAKRKLADIDMLHKGSSDLSTEMGIAGQYKHVRMREAYEATTKAARAHGKSMGVGGVREDLEFQTRLMQLGMRYLTGGSDVGYVLSAGRADVRRLREVRLS